jgi:hypothetical protein
MSLVPVLSHILAVSHPGNYPGPRFHTGCLVLDLHKTPQGQDIWKKVKKKTIPFQACNSPLPESYFFRDISQLFWFGWWIYFELLTRSFGGMPTCRTETLKFCMCRLNSTTNLATQHLPLMLLSSSRESHTSTVGWAVPQTQSLMPMHVPENCVQGCLSISHVSLHILVV